MSLCFRGLMRNWNLASAIYLVRGTQPYIFTLFLTLYLLGNYAIFTTSDSEIILRYAWDICKICSWLKQIFSFNELSKGELRYFPFSWVFLWYSLDKLICTSPIKKSNVFKKRIFTGKSVLWNIICFTFLKLLWF